MTNSVNALNIYKDKNFVKKSFSKSWEGIFFYVLVSLFALLVVLNIFIGHSPSTSNASALHVSMFSRDESGEFYLLGTNAIGQDLFSQLVYGICFSLIIGIFISLLNTLIAIFLSLEHASNKKTSGFIKLLVELASAIPSIFVLMILSVLITQISFFSLVLVFVLGLCLTGWVSIYNQINEKVSALYKSGYVALSKSLGVKSGVIKMRIIKMVMPLIITQFLLMVPKIILSEVTIGFLGLIPSTYITLGTMANSAMNYVFTNPIEMVVPICGIVAITLATHLLGYGMLQTWQYNGKIN